MGKRTRYKEDYISYWNSKGDYGKMRVLRMRIRKHKRYEKQKYKVRFGIRIIDGKQYQLCDYQPGFSNNSWCEYPCNGDC